MLSDTLWQLRRSEKLSLTAGVGGSMADIQRIYHRTIEGHRALRTRARLAGPQRKVIALVRNATPLNHIAANLRECSQTQLLSYLGELEAAGLVDSIPMQWLIDLYALADYQPRYQPRPLSH
jgi:hypothetical protein